MIDAGKLKDRVSHQTATYAIDASGQMIPTWTTQGTYWANVETLQGQEEVIASQLRPSTTHLVTMRYRAIAPKDRLVYKGRTLNITAVLNIEERDVMLKLYCEEVPGDNA